MELKAIVDLLKLIRWLNLLLIAITQYLVKYFLLNPIFNKIGVEQRIDNHYFHFLVISTLCIAAAGYVINDYFDTRIDLINKPTRLIIGKTIKRRTAIIIHTLFNITGLLLAYKLSILAGNRGLVLFQLITVLGLWYYSLSLKRKFFTGNFVVSLFAALAVLLPSIYEYKFIWIQDENSLVVLKTLMATIVVYSSFSFLLNFAREITKDIEDIEGDLDSDCKTIPIVMGIALSKKIIAAIIIALMGFIFYYLYVKLGKGELIIFIYVLLTVMLPLTITIYKLSQSILKFHFKIVGNWLKITMALGLLSIPILYFLEN